MRQATSQVEQPESGDKGQSLSAERWPMLPYPFRPLKHSYLVAGLALQLFKLRTFGVQRFIFTATTGRSGTLTLSKLFSTVRGCCALHEPHPVMHGSVLRAASYGDTQLVDRVYWRIKALNIHRAAAGHRFYFEANHLFIKTFVDAAAEDFGRRLAVVHLVRPAAEVANSIYSLQDPPGTEQGNYWWLDFRAPTNLLSMADVLESDPEFSHPFYKALWYWHEVEARIAAWRARRPDIHVVDFETRWLNDIEHVANLFDLLGLEYDSVQLAKRVGVKEHTKHRQKVGAALPPEEAAWRASQFKELLAQMFSTRPTARSNA